MAHDYIIVGAGTAGCVLANRLSKNQNNSVLLLEAGGRDKKREIHIPAAFSKLFKTEVDWAYFTEPQAHVDQRKLYWPRGKMLGGSGSMNAMIYIRGNHRDYDNWAKLGNEEWGSRDVLPYFKKSENQERGASSYHGVGGALNVADLRSPNPLSQVFIEAAAQVGLPKNNNFNGKSQEGAGFYQVTQKKGQRLSTAGAYLKPAMKRSNLTVMTHAQATRLSFDGKRVTGIEYVQKGKTKQAKANKEVILCGGTINSPQLLMLSGIGAAEHLWALGIPVLVNLPGVGQNLSDHTAVGVGYACKKPITLVNATSFGNLLRYLLFKKGPLTSNVGEAGGFVKTRPDLPVPDIQIHFAPAYFLDHGFVQPEGHGFTVGITLVQPKSRGYIKLRSRDPLLPPLIQPNYCAADEDMQTLIAGLKLARQIGQASAFDAYRGEELLPGSDVQEEKGLRAFIRKYLETLYHPVGTCKMGNDPQAVVNSQLQVHGVEGLRVVDASIMPTITTGNTNAPTIMIAEKAADMI
jgi:choline dehydrogenase